MTSLACLMRHPHPQKNHQQFLDESIRTSSLAGSQREAEKAQKIKQKQEGEDEVEYLDDHEPELVESSPYSVTKEVVVQKVFVTLVVFLVVVFFHFYSEMVCISSICKRSCKSKNGGFPNPLKL